VREEKKQELDARKKAKQAELAGIKQEKVKSTPKAKPESGSGSESDPPTESEDEGLSLAEAFTRGPVTFSGDKSKVMSEKDAVKSSQSELREKGKPGKTEPEVVPGQKKPGTDSQAADARENKKDGEEKGLKEGEEISFG
jgi:hypothetical protein